MDQAQRGHALGDPAAHFRESIIDDQHRRPAVAQGVFDFRLAPADVHRHNDGTGPCNGKIEFQIAILIKHQHRNTITRADIHRAQRTGETRDALTDL